MRLVSQLVLATAAVLASAQPSAAQSLGTFRWQLSPFCNVLTLHVTAVAGVFRLEGYDDQCSGRHAAVIGMAVPNLDGSVGFGLNVVATAGDLPLNLNVSFDASTLGGTWYDTAGNSGTLIFSPSTASGNPRPAATLLIDGSDVLDGSIGAGDVDTAQVQRRVSGVCPAGQFVRSVNQDGTLNCGLDATSIGDITAVTAGAGLLGGGATGDVALTVSFAGPGVAPTVARSDHTHQAGSSTTNTAAGAQAMSSVTTGDSNTALGESSLGAMTTGLLNTAVGRRALALLTEASQNTAVGALALNGLSSNVLNNTAIGAGALVVLQSGQLNTAVGALGLFNNTSGSGNVAVGGQALISALGSANIGLGANAGSGLTNGDFNIYVGNDGANESSTIRIGSSPTQNRAFLAGVRGVTTGIADAVLVVIDSNGQLGTVSSSRRFKQDIADLGDVGRRIQQLRPVHFRYRQAAADGSHPLQYGLIAEEVAAVLPELVAHDAAGEIETVKYHILPTLLLAEVQRLERERARQAQEIAELRAIVNALTQR